MPEASISVNTDSLARVQAALGSLFSSLEQKRRYQASIRGARTGEIHRRLLTELGRGIRPTVERLAEQTELKPETVVDELRALADHDLIEYVDGTIESAYPFAGYATQHEVSIGDIRVSSLCAIDALGIPLMLNRDVRIGSSCPECGKPISMAVEDSQLYVSGDDIVVWIPLRKIRRQAATDVCPYIDFVCSRNEATRHQQVLGYEGMSLDLSEALALSHWLFHDWLD